MKPIIAYVRVSTQKQGRSGLGLEAQIASIRAFAAAEGFEIAQTFIEVETGKGSDALATRPQLAAAIAAATAIKGTLVVAKLDRLTRNVAFGSALMQRGDVSFRLADNPNANNFMIHILLALAEKERQDISDRTIAALQAAKARGQKLGNQAQADANADAALAFAETLRDVVTPIINLSSRRIAAALNADGHRTADGCAWQSKNVLRLINRLKEAA
jgi:DNA invertase Pin-like site-specific DNA recombinase